jgi:hypothetical protein
MVNKCGTGSMNEQVGVQNYYFPTALFMAYFQHNHKIIYRNPSLGELFKKSTRKLYYPNMLRFISYCLTMSLQGLARHACRNKYHSNYYINTLFCVQGAIYKQKNIVWSHPVHMLRKWKRGGNGFAMALCKAI